MKILKILIRALLIIIGLFVLLMLVIAGTVHILNRTNGAIVSSGVKREYLLYIPSSYDRTKAAPLVISMHGAAGWPAQQMKMSHWNRLADENGFILVCPSGSSWPRIWHVDYGAGLARDVKFISDLIDKLEGEYNINRARIYVNGLSNGGGMTFVLSCMLSNRIAAVGLVSAAQSLPWSWCTDHHPVPMIAFHGTADPIVPFNGGPTGDALNPVKIVFPAVRDWIANWAQRNGCERKPQESVVASDVTRIEYGNCTAQAEVVLYTVQGGGHSWPGGKPLPKWWVGPTTTSIDATRVMWDFFRKHPLHKYAKSES